MFRTNNFHNFLTLLIMFELPLTLEMRPNKIVAKIKIHLYKEFINLLYLYSFTVHSILFLIMFLMFRNINHLAHDKVGFFDKASFHIFFHHLIIVFLFFLSLLGSENLLLQQIRTP